MIFRAASPDSTPRPIGTIKLLHSREFTRHYETASWYTKIECKPQTSVLFSNGYYVSAGFDGVVSSSYFPSSFGGLSYGDSNPDKECGKASTGSVQWYAYEFARLMGNFCGYEVELFDEYGYDSAPYKHDPTKIGHFLTVKSDAYGDQNHPMDVVRINSEPFQDEHEYTVIWRGDLIGKVYVKRYEGFNGNTLTVAFRKGATMLMEKGLIAA